MSLYKVSTSRTTHHDLYLDMDGKDLQIADPISGNVVYCNRDDVAAMVALAMFLSSVSLEQVERELKECVIHDGRTT